MPAPSSRFIPLGSQGALPASTGVEAGTGLDRLFESPGATPTAGPSPVSGSLTSQGRSALGVAGMFTGLAPGLVSIPGLGLAGKGAEMAGFNNASGLAGLIAGLAGMSGPATMLAVDTLAGPRGQTLNAGMANTTMGETGMNLGEVSNAIAGVPGLVDSANPTTPFGLANMSELASQSGLTPALADTTIGNILSGVGSGPAGNPAGSLAGLQGLAANQGMSDPAGTIGAISEGGDQTVATPGTNALVGNLLGLGFTPSQVDAALAGRTNFGQRGLIDSGPVPDAPPAPPSVVGNLADDAVSGDEGGPGESGDTGGVGAGGTGGSGDDGAYKFGGKVRDRSKLPGGAEPITAHEGEFVVNAPAAKAHMATLKKFNKGGLARLMED